MPLIGLVVPGLRELVMRYFTVTDDLDVAIPVRCPHCGSPTRQIHRRLRDRMISLLIPLRRYRCGNLDCRWEGNLRFKKMAD